MTITQAVALGVLQGATEFLPVSSSGHLALAENALSSAPRSDLLFDVVVHLGTLLAILLLLRQRVGRLLRAALSFVPGTRAADPVDRRWVGLILLGSLPTALFGLLLRDATTAMHAQPAAVGGALLVTAGILFASERFGRRTRGARELGVPDALLIGTLQGLAVLPGISRSGATVGAALWRDVDGTTAVEFSMLLSVPAVLGANALEMGRAGGEALRGEALPLLVGFAVAFATGALGLRALQWVVASRRLLPFAVYCAALGAGAIALG